jgi:hypothetical protein
MNGAFRSITPADVMLTADAPFTKVPPAREVKVSAPAATEIVATPAPTVTKNPPAPTNIEIGPAVLFTVYLGTASAPVADGYKNIS